MKYFLTLISSLFIGLTMYGQDVSLQRVADLVPEGYSITGQGFLEELTDGALQLRLSDDFDTPPGPDVRILLNNSLQLTNAVEIVNLSDIGHFSGALTVDVPSSININDYDFILFYCVQFNLAWASGAYGEVMILGAPTCDESGVFNQNGLEIVDICPTDNSDDIIEFENSLGLDAGDEYVYLITDENEILLEVVEEDFYDFEGSSLDVQRVYGLQYSGDLDISIGSPRTSTTASDCFEHSDDQDFITITKNACFECFNSAVANVNGSNTIDVCPTDGDDDLVFFENSLDAPIGSEYVYLVTDQNENLIELVFDDRYDFEGTSTETQRVYGMHFDGVLDPNFGGNRLSTTASGCFEHSNNSSFIEITKNACFECFDSYTFVDESADLVNICASDGIADSVKIKNNIDTTLNMNYAYIVTDTNEVAQLITMNPIIDFEGSGSDEQRVYGVHFNGNLNPGIGLHRSLTTASDCYVHSDSEDFVTILKDACPPSFMCESSTVSSNGASTIDLCPTDGNNDVIALSNNINVSAGNNYAYLITDENQIVQQVIQNNSYNFEGSDLSVQRVYGIHFEGVLSPQIGNTRTATSASGCFTHSSDNTFLTISKNACTPFFNCLSSEVTDINGNSNFSICASDGESDVITFQNSLGLPPGENYVYLLTDENEVLIDVISTPSFDFEGSSENTQRVYGFHYNGELNVQIGFGRMITTATDCFAHSSSDSFITITKDACPPPFNCLSSSITDINGSATIDLCPNDGANDVIAFRNSLNENTNINYAYLLTDENDVLEEVIMSSSYNFEGSSDQTQRIHGIHFNGTLQPVIGQLRTLTSATDCFAHSNDGEFLTIMKQACVPEFVCEFTLTATTDWATSVQICATDGVEDRIELKNNLSIEAGENYAYLITDENDILQEVSFEEFYDFEGSGENETRIYGVHFSGTLNPQIGQNRLATTATECFEHSGSSLFLTITKDGCEEAFDCMATVTATTNWESSISICTLDGEEDMVELRNNLSIAPGSNYAYLITDANENLLDVSFREFYDFEGSGISEQRVYGIHYDGTLNTVLGTNRMETTATGCFTHSGSDIFLTINKEEDCGPVFECKPSLTASTDWENSRNICPSDGVADWIDLKNNLFIEPGDNYAYLITDERGILMDVSFDSIYNFDGTPALEQRVYGIHYDGILMPQIGEDRLLTTSSGCFEHSGAGLFLTIRKSVCADEDVCVLKV